jgi:transaldolase
MKIFCDSADYKNFLKYKKDKFVKGFTTNPSLMRLAGAKNYKNYSLKLLKNSNSKSVSLEVFSDDIDEMYKQGKIINKWAKNVYVKIPVVNTQGKFTGKTIEKLSNEKVKLNITAIYSFEQVKKITKKLNKKTKAIISIFAGRMGDQLKNPIPIFKKSISFTKKFKNIEILWASTRETYNYLEANQLGCQIITMPPKIIEQIKNAKKTYNQLTIDTVKGFYKDAKKSKFNI